jgi:hypothetical protein
MSRNHYSTQLLLALSLLAGAFAPTPARADDASCKPVMDAMMKQIRTVYRETITLKGKPARELIHTTTAFYYQGKDARAIRYIHPCRQFRMLVWVRIGASRHSRPN